MVTLVSSNGKYLMVALVVVMAGLVGGWVAGRPASHAKASAPVVSTFGMYSYRDATCSVIADPVTAVFTFGDGSPGEPYQFAKRPDHGGWAVGWTNPGQYFLVDKACSKSDGQAASGAETRYHVRWKMAYTADFGWAYAATPHHEDWDWSVPLVSGQHCVRPGGFDQARNELVRLWSQAAAHGAVTYEFWGNTYHSLKCDGQYAGSDGIVAYINMSGKAGR